MFVRITFNINGDLFDRMERIARVLAPDARPPNGLTLIHCIKLADELIRRGGHGADTEITIHSPQGDRRLSIDRLIGVSDLTPV